MKIKKTKSVSPITNNLNKTSKILKAEAKDFERYQREANSNVHKKTLKQHIAQLKALTKQLVGRITVSNALEHIDKERIHRARTQLRVYFLSSIKKDGTFRFVVKSSGISPSPSYNVEVKFKDVENQLFAEVPINEIIMHSKILTQCSCDDFKYRFRYWLTTMQSVLGVKEHRFPKIRNPHSEHLFMCKHQALVMNAITKPSFKHTIFTRYIKNLEKGKATRITKADTQRTLLASQRSKIK